MLIAEDSEFESQTIKYNGQRLSVQLDEVLSQGYVQRYALRCQFLWPITIPLFHVIA